MLADFTAWLLNLVSSIFTAIWQFFLDVAIEVFDLLLVALVGIFGAISAPSFLTAGLGSLFSGLDPATLYLVGMLRIPEALAMIGVAYGVRLIRVFVTLFQWS
jgi:hypothetical protein